MNVLWVRRVPSAVVVARADMSFSSVGVARRAWAHATLKPPTFRMFAASRSVPWLDHVTSRAGRRWQFDSAFEEQPPVQP